MTSPEETLYQSSRLSEEQIHSTLESQINPTEINMAKNEVDTFVPQMFELYQRTYDDLNDKQKAKLEAQIHIFMVKHGQQKHLEEVKKINNPRLLGELSYLAEGENDFILSQAREYFSDGEYDKAKQFTQGLLQSPDEEQLNQILDIATSGELDTTHAEILINVANTIGFPYALELLRQRGDTEAAAFLTPGQDAETLSLDLWELYKKINFENYEVNQKATRDEADLFEEIIPDKTARILDDGMGTGRMLGELEARGYTNLVGIDQVKSHVDKASQNTQAELVQANWHELPFKDESFDAVYSLGRNFLHNVELHDQLTFLREARRVLTKGGTLVLDIPDVTKGSYKVEVEKFSKDMEEKGIVKYSKGTIYDTPDGEHCFNRFAPSHEQMLALIRLSGFKLREIKERAIPNGGGDVNMYYVLEKDPVFDPNAITPDELYEALKQFST
jgi:ubiquinone/menaquinone biosynthesis C-methylase UbiE